MVLVLGAPALWFTSVLMRRAGGVSGPLGLGPPIVETLLVNLSLREEGFSKCRPMVGIYKCPNHLSSWLLCVP